MPEIGSVADLVVFGVPLLGALVVVVFRGDVFASQPKRHLVQGHEFSELDGTGLIEPDGRMTETTFVSRIPEPDSDGTSLLSED